MLYKVIITDLDDDVAGLRDLKFYDNVAGKEEPLKWDNDTEGFAAIRVWHNEETQSGIAVAINCWTPLDGKGLNTEIEAYTYIGEKHRHRNSQRISDLNTIKNLIQDLIDEGFIEEVTE